MSISENQVLALAGLFQATTLLDSLAREGRCDEEAQGVSLGSILRLDSASAADIFGGASALTPGYQALYRHLTARDRDMNLTRYAVALMHMERRFSHRQDLKDNLAKELASVSRQVEHLGIGHAQVAARLGEIYEQLGSQLPPRILVFGSPLHLSQPAIISQIRALLLAGLRAAVLWRQVGGRRWHFLLKRRQLAELAAPRALAEG